MCCDQHPQRHAIGGGLPPDIIPRATVGALNFDRVLRFDLAPAPDQSNVLARLSTTCAKQTSGEHLSLGK